MTVTTQIMCMIFTFTGYLTFSVSTTVTIKTRHGWQAVAVCPEDFGQAVNRLASSMKMTASKIITVFKLSLAAICDQILNLINVVLDHSYTTNYKRLLFAVCQYNSMSTILYNNRVGMNLNGCICITLLCNQTNSSAHHSYWVVICICLWRDSP